MPLRAGVTCRAGALFDEMAGPALNRPGDPMSDDPKNLTPARLRAMAAWFREFAALGSAEQRKQQLDLARYYERLALERESAAPPA